MAAAFLILLLDDDPYLADQLNRAARSAFKEAEFIFIQNSIEAFSYLEGLPNRRLRLVLVDINLRDALSGLDFLTLWRSHPLGRLVPIVALSTDHTQILSIEAYRRGANAFSRKPFSYEGWKNFLSAMRQYWLETVTTLIT